MHSLKHKTIVTILSHQFFSAQTKLYSSRLMVVALPQPATMPEQRCSAIVKGMCKKVNQF